MMMYILCKITHIHTKNKKDLKSFPIAGIIDQHKKQENEIYGVCLHNPISNC